MKKEEAIAMSERIMGEREDRRELYEVKYLTEQILKGFELVAFISPRSTAKSLIREKLKSLEKEIYLEIVVVMGLEE